MKTKLLLSITIISFILLLVLQDTFGSTSFPRQEILDDVLDWRDGKSNLIGEGGDTFTDIETITYLTDGKIFNATLWLTGPPKENPRRDMVTYGILIDADSNNKTGLYGFDYSTEILWDGSIWSKVVKERTRFNEIRILSEEKNFTNFFDGGTTVDLSFDLTMMGSPVQYSLAFYTAEITEIGNSKKTIYDFSSLVNIPPPEFFVSTLPESIVLRQDESKLIQVEVKSTTGFQPKVGIDLEPIDNITLNLISSELNIPPFGIATTPVNIKAKKTAELGPHTLFIKATATFPLDQITRTDESDKDIVIKLEEKFVVEKIATVTVEIIPAATVEENFLDFVQRWEIPITIFVLLISSGGVLFFFRWLSERGKIKQSASKDG